MEYEVNKIIISLILIMLICFLIGLLYYWFSSDEMRDKKTFLEWILYHYHLVSSERKK